VDKGPIAFEGGPLDGQRFQLPPGTIEIHIAGVTPGNDRYQIIVRDAGVFAMWVGEVARDMNQSHDAAARS
jgi:hypothetical protein